MKKIFARCLALFLIFALALSLAACSGLPSREEQLEQATA